MELIGRKIAGKFVVESEIGRGGMGTVFKARQIDLDKEVAIKVLKEGMGEEQEFASRFKREAKAASKIDHPNSMRVLDFGQEPDGLLYIAMELLDGKSLHDIIKDEAPLAPVRIADLTRQTLAALAAAHDIGILHRDLKPENIIVVKGKTDEGHQKEIVKVCDFGIAKIAAASGDTPGASHLTSAGSIVGTPDYMSPEQARGTSDLDPRTDLYSAGVMMYEMMTRHLPFVANTPLGVVLMHLNETPAPPSKHVPDVDPRLEAICLRAMSKKPEERYANAREMRAALSLEGDMATSQGALFQAAPIASPSSKRKLLMVPEPSVTVQAQTVTAMAAPKSGPMRSSPSAKEMLSAPDGLPTQSAWPAVAMVLVAMSLVAGGIWYLTHQPQKAGGTEGAIADPTIPSTIPNKPISSAPIAIVSAAAPRVLASASAMPSASVSAAPSASSAVPVVASVSGKPVTTAPIPSGKPTTTSSAPIIASATVPPPPPPPPSPLHVTAANITSEKIASSAIQAALPLARFEQCYRDGTQGGKIPIGLAKLHITLTSTQTESSFAGSPELSAAVGACVVGAANKIAVDVPPGGATAAIDLLFKTD